MFFHLLLTDRPLGGNAPLALYLNAFSIAGLAAYVYTQVLARRLRRRDHTVKSVRVLPGATENVLAPRGRKLDWQPGQFAFLSAPASGLAEFHPFTIARPPASDGILGFAIKGLGDWTSRLPVRLKAGDLVQVEGPYGRFDMQKGGMRQVWLAGGIGITPFLAFAASLTEGETRRIHLVYCLRARDEAIGLDVLDRAAATTANFTYSLVVGNQDGRLTAEKLVAMSPVALREADLFVCGPDALRRDIADGLAAAGASPRRVHFELFEFR